MRIKTISQNDIIGVYVSYFDGGGGKRRPVLILENRKDELIFFSITSQFKNKSAKIKRQYYKIIDWQLAGLNKISYVDIGNVLEVNKNELGAIIEMRSLTTKDVHELDVFIRNYKDSINNRD